MSGEQYTPEEITAIKNAVLHSKSPAKCPRCDVRFKEKVVGGGGTVSAISEHTCPQCGISVTVSDFFR
jgi:ribosomal protein L37AE/L43A